MFENACPRVAVPKHFFVVVKTISKVAITKTKGATIALFPLPSSLLLPARSFFHPLLLLWCDFQGLWRRKSRVWASFAWNGLNFGKYRFQNCSYKITATS